jgi:hypothetical protein
MPTTDTGSSRGHGMANRRRSGVDGDAANLCCRQHRPGSPRPHNAQQCRYGPRTQARLKAWRSTQIASQYSRLFFRRQGQFAK